MRSISVAHQVRGCRSDHTVDAKARCKYFTSSEGYCYNFVVKLRVDNPT
jgi:hypothetical protein